MKDNIFLETDRAIYDILSNNKFLKELKIGIYFEIPSGTSFPYIHIGKSSLKNISTKTSELYKIIKEINIFSSNNGTKQLLIIINEIIHALKLENFKLKNESIISSNMDEYNIFIKAENIYHLSCKFELYIEN
ncbi:MAG: hypothetical protein ACK4OM_03870 [Alphaproteobacteria bacterium]